MKNINNLNEYHKYISTTGGFDNKVASNNGSHPSSLGWIVIVLIVIMLVFFIANGASLDAIDTLLGLGFLSFLFFNWLGK